MNQRMRLLNIFAALLLPMAAPCMAAVSKTPTAAPEKPVSSPGVLSPEQPVQPEPTPVAETPVPASTVPALSATVAAAIHLPAAEPIARYQAIIDHSPFALATQSAPPPPAADAAGFAKDLVLTGVVRLAAGEYVTISSRDQSQRFGLSRQDTYNGISIANVAWADGIGKTKVTLKRGSEYGVIGFDEALLRTGAAGMPLGGTPASGDPAAGGLSNNTPISLPAGMVPPNANTGSNPDVPAQPPGITTAEAGSGNVTPPPSTDQRPLPLRRRIIRTTP